MMKMFRTLLFGLLCFAISLQGFAGVALFEKPCPLESGAQSAEMIAMAAMAADHDCCNDADTFAKTGKLCKTGQECSAGGIGLIASCRIASFSPVHPLRIDSPDQPIFDAAPAGIWRPPTLS